MKTHGLKLWVAALAALLTLAGCSGDDDGDGGDDSDTGTPMDTADNGDDTTGGETGGETGMSDYQVVDCSNVSPAKTVKVVSNEFQPQTVSVSVGDVVMWDWEAGGHSVTSGDNCSPDGKFDSTVKASSDATFCVQFDTAGNVPYHCIPHCSVGMTGTVEVSQ